MVSTEEPARPSGPGADNAILAAGLAVLTLMWGLADSFWVRVGPAIAVFLLAKLAARLWFRQRRKAVRQLSNGLTAGTVGVYLVVMTAGAALTFDDHPVRVGYWIVAAALVATPVVVAALRNR